MGGKAKGLLPSPATGEPLIERLVGEGRKAKLEPVLVGEAGAYAAVAAEVPRLADDPPGMGPLGGLRALLLHADGRRVIAVACDMPYVDATALEALATGSTKASVLSLRRGSEEPWEPLLARYAARDVLPVLDRGLSAGWRSFQRLFAELQAAGLEVAELPSTREMRRALEDWDAPEDIR